MPIFLNDEEDIPDYKPRVSPSNVYGSEVCETCHERYTSVPVIDGKPQCPRCDKP